MPTVKHIVCLANSRKPPNGRYVAGKEIWENGRLGRWIRPVSDRESGEVSLNEQRYKDGSTPRLLDIVEIPLLRAEPHLHQQENWVLDKHQRWTKVGRVQWADLEQMCDPLSPRWVNGHGTSIGSNDRLPINFARNLESSLRLVEID